MEFLINQPLAIYLFQKNRVIIDKKGIFKTNPLIKGCNSTNYNYSDFLVNQNIYIDINEFEKNLQLILNK